MWRTMERRKEMRRRARKSYGPIIESDKGRILRARIPGVCGVIPRVVAQFFPVNRINSLFRGFRDDRHDKIRMRDRTKEMPSLLPVGMTSGWAQVSQLRPKPTERGYSFWCKSKIEIDHPRSLGDPNFGLRSFSNVGRLVSLSISVSASTQRSTLVTRDTYRCTVKHTSFTIYIKMGYKMLGKCKNLLLLVQALHDPGFRGNELRGRDPELHQLRKRGRETSNKPGCQFL